MNKNKRGGRRGDQISVGATDSLPRKVAPLRRESLNRSTKQPPGLLDILSFLPVVSALAQNSMRCKQCVVCGSSGWAVAALIRVGFIFANNGDQKEP